MTLSCLALAATIGAVGVTVLGDEKNRVALLDREGFIETGEKFGVSIGQPPLDIPGVLVSDNFKFIDARFGGSCLRRDYAQTAKVHVYVDDGWRKITLCIAEQADRIVSVQWHAAPLQAEL